MAHKLKKIPGTYTPDKDIIKENPRRRIVENGIDIDFSVFKKTDSEKLTLKVAKAMAKRGIEYKHKSYKRSKRQRQSYRAKQLRLLSEARGEKTTVPLTSPPISDNMKKTAHFKAV